MKNSLFSRSLFKFTVLAAFAAGLLSFSGCRTMEGAGEDIENAGEEIQDAAK